MGTACKLLYAFSPSPCPQHSPEAVDESFCSPHLVGKVDFGGVGEGVRGGLLKITGELI